MKANMQIANGTVAVGLVLLVISVLPALSVSPGEKGVVEHLEVGSTGMLDGVTDFDKRMYCGWIDLGQSMHFKSGDRLLIRLGGTARQVLVRLLPAGQSASRCIGVVGGVVEVPASRILDIQLRTAHKNIVQVSVHGGPNPWGLYPMGGGNGIATVESIEVLRDGHGIVSNWE